MMSDVNGLVVTDVLGLAQPLQKLIKTVAIGVGKVYEPTHIRRMAKAKADEIQIISKSINKNIALPIHYEDGAICIAAEDANELARRAQNRALYQEMKKQQNIESVIAKAYDQLENTEEVSEDPVDPDWINEFFDNVANVSNEEMQVFWGKLLAGEVSKPKSFSLRTLATLKNLTNYEAQIFTKVAPYILGNIADLNEGYINYFLLSDPNLLEHNGISFGQILRLSEAGLVTVTGNTMIGFDIEPKHHTVIINRNKCIHIKNSSDQRVALKYPVYPLTEAGTELFPIACNTKDLGNDDYILDCLDYLRHKGFGAFYNDSWPQEISASIE